MTTEELKSRLKFKIQKAGKRDPSYGLRLGNIEFISNLDRKKLTHSKKEKDIFFWETDEEVISIRFPGKESISEKNPRPWDFRPKLFYKSKKKYEEDLSFGQIWEILEKVYEQTKDEINVRAVAALIYRMAFMLDVHKLDEFQTKESIITYKNNSPKFSEKKTINLPNFYSYSPDGSVIQYLQEKLGNFGGMSLSAFLHYNHLLALNEDCKYYYRNKIKAKKDKTKIAWINGTGRVNNLLTHISILSHYFGNTTIAQLVYSVIIQRGVCPCTAKEVKIVCDGFVEIEDDADEDDKGLFD